MSIEDQTMVSVPVVYLNELMEIMGPCSHDHHGYCQAHFVEIDCLIERFRKTLNGPPDAF